MKFSEIVDCATGKDSTVLVLPFCEQFLFYLFYFCWGFCVCVWKNSLLTLYCVFHKLEIMQFCEQMFKQFCVLHVQLACTDNRATPACARTKTWSVKTTSVPATRPPTWRREVLMTIPVVSITAVTRRTRQSPDKTNQYIDQLVRQRIS